MSLDDLLKNIFSSQWHVLLLIGGFLLVLGESGFRQGLHLHENRDQARKEQVGTLQAAVLGLLGLLLGFTFSMAIQRYEARRDLVVQEANSIGTTYLRAGLLDEPHRSAVEGLLRRYVEARLRFYSAHRDQSRISAAEQTTAELQHLLWHHALLAAHESPSPIVATFITSLNEVIDLDTLRLAAMENHVPGVVWLLIFLVAGSGCWASGYAGGATGKRTAFAQWVLPALITTVVTLLVDFDATRRGLISVSQQSLIDLRHSIAQP